MTYDWHNDRFYDDVREVSKPEDSGPLNIKRTKVIIELEVMADISKYGNHQIVLCHPDLEGSLTFEVDSLEQAEDALDEFEMDCIEDPVEPEEIKVAPKPQTPPPYKPQYSYSNPQNTYKPAAPQPKVEIKTETVPPKPKPTLHFEPDGPIRQKEEPMEKPKLEPETKPNVEEVNLRKKPEPRYNEIEDHPVVTILSDVAELSSIFSGIKAKWKGIKGKVG